MEHERVPGRVLGVDLGLKRTGLALSDELRLTTRALENLTPRSRAEDIATLVALCREHEVRDVVVGYPSLPRSGDEGPMARRARGFADALREALAAHGVGVHLVDETGTSKLAARRLVESGVKRSRRKAALDSEAARVLIETFIAEGPSTETASVPPHQVPSQQVPAPQGSAPQGSAPQGSAPQGSAPQSSTPQGSAHRSPMPPDEDDAPRAEG